LPPARRFDTVAAMARYEFSEGTSNKFWDIQLAGASFTTTWGKIGTAGQTTTKSFPSDDKARLEHDKLVAEKVKKGYVLVGGGETPAPVGATRRTTAAAPVVAPPVTAPPVAAAPVAAPPVVAAPVVAPPVRATAPAAGAPLASSRPASVEVTWTDLAKRHLAFEQRGLAVAPRAVPSVAAAQAAVRAGYQERKAPIAAGCSGGDAASRELAHQVIEALEGERRMARPDVATAAAILQLVGVPHYRSTTAHGDVIDLLVALGGLGFALEVFAATLGDREVVAERDVVRLSPVPRRTAASYLHHRSDLILHGHWLGLDPAAQASVRAQAEALRQHGSLIVRSALASALLLPSWVDRDLADARATGERAVLSPQALLVAGSADDVAAYLGGLEDDDARIYDREPEHHARWHGHANPGIEASLVARFGADGVVPLAARVAQVARHLDTAQYYVNQRIAELRRALEVMRSVGGRPEVPATAVAVFVAVGDRQVARDEDARPIARDCLIADPHAALPLVRAHGRAAWARELLPQLERLVAGPARVDYAEPVDLPPVLQTPAPAKTKFPEFWNPTLLPPLELAGGKAVPPAHLGALVVALRDGDADGLRGLRDVADRKALAAFGWELFQLWLQAGAPPKEKWAFTGLGALGNDETARRLTPLIRAWPGESQHARATLGLDVLGQIGSDVALMMLNGIAQKLKFKGLQERARDKMREIAETRGITAEQLADRLVPDLDLEDDGSKTLDFGPRSFRVGFDEALAPFVMDAAGTRLKDLPKPNSKDDAALATAATDTWKAMKKDARAVASIQLTRLELAMGNARRWSGEEFRAFFVEHPLLFHVVKRLVWAVFDGERPVATFRVAEDRSYADRHDDGLTLDDDAQVGIAHRLHLTEADEQAWTRVFGDYELEAPFAQLGREVFRLTAAEAAATALTRYEGKRVETRKLLGLLSRGWFKGPAQDAGGIFNLYKPLEGGRSAAISMHDGLNAGGMDYVDPVQTLETVDVAASRREWGEVRSDAVPLGSLPAVVVSEIIRDLESLGAAS
jgi:predicted DNA-binding WGR domain protein